MSEATKGERQPERRIDSEPGAIGKTAGLSYKKGGARKTYSQKPAEVSRAWHLLDASQTTMGRLATVAASLLLGKHKPTVTSHIDGGDYVIIINADKMIVSGGKQEKKIYYHHSGFPGGLRERQLKEVPATEALYQAIRGMLPVNKLRDGRLKRVKIYAGEEHNHSAQTPTLYDLTKGSK